MQLEASTRRHAVGKDIHLTFFVKERRGKPTRVAFARLLDISNGGLCMEISPLDSDLFMESQGKLYILNRNIEMQMFCRSHPTNVTVAGHVQWFKRRKDLDDLAEDDDIYIGVIFSYESALQREEVSRLLEHLGNEVVHCQNCNTQISAEAALCYNCGVKLVRKRTLFRRMIFGFLTGSDNPD